MEPPQQKFSIVYFILTFVVLLLLVPEVDLAQVAARTPGFVGADLANLVNEAALRAAREGKAAVEMADKVAPIR
jgi:ATP-dependent Zn protease